MLYVPLGKKTRDDAKLASQASEQSQGYNASGTREELRAEAAAAVAMLQKRSEALSTGSIHKPVTANVKSGSTRLVQK